MTTTPTLPPATIQRLDHDNLDLPGGEHVYTFWGVLLSEASSHRPEHLAHRGQFAAPRETCSTCRWTEVAIFKQTMAPSLTPGNFVKSDDYVIHRVGRSIVPGESDRFTVDIVGSGFEVVEVLTTRRDGREPFLIPQHARILAAASHLDEGIREAYVNRAVI